VSRTPGVIIAGAAETNEIGRVPGQSTLALHMEAALNAVRDADNIVVLADGVVVEQGDHDALMADGGTYARLFSLQARGFIDRAPDTAMSGALGGIENG